MILVVGLGNPGKEYDKTRHNAGFLFVDYVAQKLGLESFAMNKKLHAEVAKNNEFVLAKPQTFMNDSGKAVQAVLKWYGASKKRIADSEQKPSNQATEQLTNLCIAYDDLDIELGKFKIQFGSGPKIHNGLNSIREQLGTDQFWNIRIGVDNRKGDRSMPGHAYVLQKFSADELQMLPELFSQIEKLMNEKLKK